MREVLPLRGRRLFLSIASAALMIGEIVAAEEASGAPSPEAGGVFKLENDQLSVTLSRQSASIEAVARRRGQSSSRYPIISSQVLRMRMPIGLWDGHSLLANQAGGFRVRQQSSDGITLQAAGFATTEGTFPVDVQLRFRLEGDNLVVKLHLTNHGAHTIDQITFPILEVGSAVDENETVVMTSGPQRLRDLFSANTIRTHHDPFERLDPADLRGWVYSDPAISAKGYRYPYGGSPLHTAWLLYSADGLGIGFDVRDKSFQTQYAVVERKLIRDRVSAANNRRTYEISWRWFPLVGRDETWESPEVYLKFGSSDWHLVAKQHREWLQRWTQEPVVAEKLQSSIGWISRSITHFDQIPSIAKTGVEVGAPYFIVYGWFGSGMNGLSYDYYPQLILGGEQSLRENLRTARALGAYPLAWYNGTTTVESTLEHQETGRHWVVVNRHGGIVLDGRWSLFDPDRPPTTDDATVHMNFDMGTAAADFNLRNIRRIILDYGFSGIEMDQGDKNYLSYSPHSRTGRPELSYTNGIRRVYEMAREIVKSNDPNGVILGEHISDFMNQYVDSSWNFEGGRLSVPGYTYYRYSLPWATLPAGVFIADRSYANQAFMMNSPLDIFLDLEAFPRYVSHLKKLHRLKQAVYSHLYRGNFSDGEGFTLGPPTGSAVMAKSYIETGRYTTVVVINTSDEPQVATVGLGDSAFWRLEEHRLEGEVVSHDDATEVHLRLAPYDVRVLVLERGVQS